MANIKSTLKIFISAGIFIVHILLIQFAGVYSGSAQIVDLDRDTKNHFLMASEATGVPMDLLLAVGYQETFLQHRNGEAGKYYAYGIMGLRSDGTNFTLEESASLIGVPADRVRYDVGKNIAAAAALMADFFHDEAGTSSKDDMNVLEKWKEPLLRYSCLSQPALQQYYLKSIYMRLEEMGYKIDFDLLNLEGSAFKSLSGMCTDAQFPCVDDESPAWNGSHANYAVSSRPGSTAITEIVIHSAEGTYAGTLSWFAMQHANCPSAGLFCPTSAHYTVALDGRVGQSVCEKDIAYHVGGHNNYTIGIEHEGYANVTAFTNDMYESSADLVRYLCDKYGIPKDRTHIRGHHEVIGCPAVPTTGCNKYDPGQGWDWTLFMSYVTAGGSCGSSCPPTLSLTGTISSGTYEASSDVTATGTVGNGSTVTVHAGNTISLNTGFTVNLGGVFTGSIATCGSGPLKTDLPMSFQGDEYDIDGLAIFKIFPNPLSDHATIRFGLEESDLVTITVINQMSQDVIRIADKMLAAQGMNEVNLEAGLLSPGIYYCEILGSNFRGIKKLIISR